ncbi:MAG: hypothetical protein Q8868_02890 [Bacteroidota bacterium]|nr:hypothetical protein [Bacteroidota bacterium]
MKTNNHLKLSISVFFFLIFAWSFSSELADTARSKLNAGCNVSINSNGIASIPAFSLGKPAVIASVNLSKGRFSFDPVLAYGLNMKPWFIDAWLHLMVVDKPAFKLRTGFNFSNFFSEYKLPDKDILQSERYWAVEVAGFYYFTPSANVSLMYWRDMGQEPGTLKGHYISLAGEKNEIKVSARVFVSASLQVFYIDYNGDNDGLFVTPKISLSPYDFPVSIFFQAIQAINSNITPFPGFRWNAGLSYTF